MATATKKSRAAGELERAPNSGVPETMRFVIFIEDRGAYHWRLVASDGASLPQPASFGTHDDAGHPARRLRDAAASARFGLPDKNTTGSRS